MYIELTTRCNMKCAHCISACTTKGVDLPFHMFREDRCGCPTLTVKADGRVVWCGCPDAPELARFPHLMESPPDNCNGEC